MNVEDSQYPEDESIASHADILQTAKETRGINLEAVGGDAANVVD